VCGLLAGCWPLALRTPALAQAPRADEPAVRVVYAASDELAAELEPTLRNESRAPGARVTVRRTAAIDPTELLMLGAEGAGTLARIFVDMTRPHRAWVFVVGRDSSRIFARSLPRAGGSAVEVAQIGEVVRSSVQALALGAQVGLSPPAQLNASAPAARPVESSRATTAPRSPRATAASRVPGANAAPLTAATLHARSSAARGSDAATAAAPAAADEGAADVHWLAGLLYGIGLRSSGGELAHGPGLYAGLRFGRAQLRPGGLVSAQFEPRRIARPGVSAQLSSCVLRAGPALDWTLGARSALGFALFAGAELLRASVQISRADWVVASDQAAIAALARLGAQVSFHLRAAEHLELALSLVGDVDLVDTRFVVRSQQGDAIIDRPWRVRPSLVLALGWY
jgi:hypothetical protein